MRAEFLLTSHIVLMKTTESIPFKVIVLISIILTFLITGILFRMSEQIHRMLGVTGSRVFSVFSSFLLFTTILFCYLIPKEFFDCWFGNVCPEHKFFPLVMQVSPQASCIVAEYLIAVIFIFYKKTKVNNSFKCFDYLSSHSLTRYKNETMTIKCSKRKCMNPAITHQKYSGLHLCETHFIEDVERKAKKEIRKQLMIEHGDKIAVALSGGKDSSAILYMLKKIFHPRSDLEFFAIAVDEGIKGFRSVTLKNAENITKELEVELRTFSFEKEFGFTLDEIAAKGFEQAPCTFCGVLRRKVLERKAKELGATKVVTAHNLDDEVQTILINYIRGDIERLSRLRGRREEFVPRIKPLRGVPEKEVALYALVAGIPISTIQCPYATRSFRFTVKKMLNEFEMKHPGTKYSLLRGYERLSEFLPTAQPGRKLLRCMRCGAPSASRICKACEIVERMRSGKS